MTVRWIADLCSNHNNDRQRIYDLIEAAVQIGCNAVKFQMFAETLYAPQFEGNREKLRQRALDAKFIPYIRKVCDEFKIEFHCTIFDIAGLQLVLPYVDELKIGSYEILNLELIRAAARTGKPLGISTGGATDKEIRAAFDMAWLTPTPTPHLVRRDITLYACDPEYPAPIENICVVPPLHHKLDTYHRIGWSDHSGRPTVIFAAIHMGAEVIEFHLDLDDMKGAESEHGHCWTTSEMSDVISLVKTMERVMSQKQRPDLEDMRKWRMDPEDGMRPIKKYRKELSTNA